MSNPLAMDFPVFVQFFLQAPRDFFRLHCEKVVFTLAVCEHNRGDIVFVDINLDVYFFSLFKHTSATEMPVQYI